MELGIYSFGDYVPNPPWGNGISPGQRLKNLVEEIELADQVGLDVFALGEHHRPDFIVSAPAIVLAAAASRTKRIKLGTAVTVLSSDDPVRVFQQFSTLDLLSDGRAEIMAGRGSFIESFHCSATTSTTTRSCSPRSLTCCSPSRTRSTSPGRAAASSGRRSPARPCCPGPSRIPCPW